MFKYCTYVNHKKKWWTVYENEKEFKKTKKVAVPLEEARKNDYILSDNGYYIPVTQVVSKAKGAMGECFIITFPGGQQYTNTKYYDSGRFRFKPFKWYRDVKPEYNMDRETPQRELFANYVLAGMGVVDAYKISFPAMQNKYDMFFQIHNLINSRYFLNKMKDKMKELADEFEASGLTKEWLGKKLVDILNSGDESASLKCKALEIATDVLKTKKDAYTEGNTIIERKGKMTPEEVMLKLKHA